MGEPPNPYRVLPSVDELTTWLKDRRETLDARVATMLAAATNREFREAVATGAQVERADVETSLLGRIDALLAPRLSPVINATGVIVHTNLGRAPVSESTAAAMADAAAASVPLEIEPETNRRGGRMHEITELIRVLTGAEAALVVNNNAAAVLLTLSALASGGEVVVSRGEAVEIGGGFRIPDVLRQSGARLVEVGTTNRTYRRDYQQAIGPETAALLKVHASNFTVSGFTASVAAGELAAIGREAGVTVIEDVGSGSLLQPADFKLGREPTLGEAIAAGVGVVTASGDKLLGGPQAGLILGRVALIERIERHPLARAVRADKATLAGIAETLRHYVRGEAVRRLPVWRMIAAETDELGQRARTIAGFPGIEGAVEVVPAVSTIGGGSLPGQEQPSVALALRPPSADGLANVLRMGRPRVFGRIDDGRVVLDLRTVLPEQDGELRVALLAALSGRG